MSKLERFFKRNKYKILNATSFLSGIIIFASMSLIIHAEEYAKDQRIIISAILVIVALFVYAVLAAAIIYGSKE